MGLINALTKALNLWTDVGVSLVVKAPLENAWSVMITECIRQGYWIIETDQAARQFAYLVPLVRKLNENPQGQKISVYVASLGQNYCCVSITADAYSGENLAAGSELLSQDRQGELIGWLIAKIEAKFSIVSRSAAPLTLQKLPGINSKTAPDDEPSFDFLQ